jgi:hypothetical protein
MKNFGRSLTREELKQIKGGTNPCPVGDYVTCDCNDGLVVCGFANGYQLAPTICNDANACTPYGGLKVAFCSTSCIPTA